MTGLSSSSKLQFVFLQYFAILQRIIAICSQQTSLLTQSILKNFGTGGGGRDSHDKTVHMVAVLADCRKVLVSTGWAISLLFSTNEHFWCCRQFSVRRSIRWSEGPDHCRLANEWVWPKS